MHEVGKQWKEKRKFFNIICTYITNRTCIEIWSVTKHEPNPNSLPLTRPISHHIHFLPNSALVNIKPYRYPHYQKTELEQQIASTLESGLIRPNFSAFSSPVLLVKKKDGSWRCCIGYRALNAITVKDRFPMPTIDELLDELGHASSDFLLLFFFISTPFLLVVPPLFTSAIKIWNQLNLSKLKHK